MNFNEPRRAASAAFRAAGRYLIELHRLTVRPKGRSRPVLAILPLQHEIPNDCPRGTRDATDLGYGEVATFSSSFRGSHCYHGEEGSQDARLAHVHDRGLSKR